MQSDQGLTRREPFTEATARYYIPHTQHLSTLHRLRNFAGGRLRANDSRSNFTVNSGELQRFSRVQVETEQTV